MTTLFLNCIIIYLFPWLISIELSHHHSQPSFTGLSKPSLSGPVSEDGLPSLLAVLEVFSIQPVLPIMLFPWTSLTWAVHNMSVDHLFTDTSIFLTTGIRNRLHNCPVHSWATGSSWEPLCLASIIRFSPLLTFSEVNLPIYNMFLFLALKSMALHFESFIYALFYYCSFQNHVVISAWSLHPPLFWGCP